MYEVCVEYLPSSVSIPCQCAIHLCAVRYEHNCVYICDMKTAILSFERASPRTRYHAVYVYESSVVTCAK